MIRLFEKANRPEISRDAVTCSCIHYASKDVLRIALLIKILKKLIEVFNDFYQGFYMRLKKSKNYKNNSNSIDLKS